MSHYQRATLHCLFCQLWCRAKNKTPTMDALKWCEGRPRRTIKAEKTALCLFQVRSFENKYKSFLWEFRSEYTGSRGGRDEVREGNSLLWAAGRWSLAETAARSPASYASLVWAHSCQSTHPAPAASLGQSSSGRHTHTNTKREKIEIIQMTLLWRGEPLNVAVSKSKPGSMGKKRPI